MTVYATDQHIRKVIADSERDADTDGHPNWCARGHYCSAQMPSGEHASRPEVWRTDVGRVVATRHRNVETRRGHLEIRVVVQLPASETMAQALCRHLITRTTWLISWVLEDSRH